MPTSAAVPGLPPNAKTKRPKRAPCTMNDGATAAQISTGIGMPWAVSLLGIQYRSSLR
jgi:hypothetical protein